MLEKIPSGIQRDGVEVYSNGAYNKDGHRADVDGDARGWWYPCAFFV